MKEFALVFLGGGLGSGARYLVTLGMARGFGRELPYGTFTANAVGSFLLGMLLTWGLHDERLAPGLRLCLPLAPDIGFEDVRMLGLPMPFLAADDLRRGALPPWLPSDGRLSLPTWKGQGPIPATLREYFPDL